MALDARTLDAPRHVRLFECMPKRPESTDPHAMLQDAHTAVERIMRLATATKQPTTAA